ncbi:MAG: hypothetical protein JW993_04195 [Sedimentisphaerales bacterium]|nr:hypothetical protein [Sedimentisphaerales bacterium]
MMPRPKLIVIDKDALIGIGLHSLCDFAKSHLLVLSDTLLYECATATKQDAKGLLRRFQTLIEMGARFCQSSIGLLQKEAESCEPYPLTLVDSDATNKIGNELASLEAMVDSEILEIVVQSRNEVAQFELVERSQQLKEAIDREHPGTVAVSKAYQGNRSDRLKEFLAAVAKMNVHDLAVALLPSDLIGGSRRFCLSPDWIAWQYVRLVIAMMYDHHYIRQTGAPRDDHAEHDRNDLDYVLLLSRADGIITKDKGLIELARAAFPEKDVFSSLEEVSESYRCDWAQ